MPAWSGTTYRNWFVQTKYLAFPLLAKSQDLVKVSIWLFNQQRDQNPKSLRFHPKIMQAATQKLPATSVSSCASIWALPGPNPDQCIKSLLNRRTRPFGGPVFGQVSAKRSGLDAYHSDVAFL